MICANCATTNDAGRKFCLECGQPLVALCPACATPNPAAAKFCGECGTALPGSADATGRTGIRAAEQSAASAVPSTAAERRRVSILFADLVGFTSAAERRDAEDVRELLSGYFGLARQIVGRYGGTIEKFIGDAVMAVWGAPVAYEDDAERAVRAALDIVDGVAALGTGLTARAAVVTGEAAVTVGAVGEGLVAGDAVNTASRLQGAAPDGAVLVSDATRNATRAAITYEPVDAQRLKGKAAAVGAWRALRVVSGRRGAGRSDALEPPFVGRDAELRQLKELLHTTSVVRRARVVSIVGQAGVGKSRLVWELEKYVDGIVEGVYWHYGRSPAHGDGITFWALGEMVRQRARIAETDDADTSRARLAEAVAEYVPVQAERAWLEPHLQTLLGLGEAAQTTDQAELFAAWRRFFERIAERGTTVLVFEDVQWADAGLLEFVASLVEWSRASPLLIITLARPELFARHESWGAGQHNFSSIHLEPLTEAEMSELLVGLAPGLPGDAVRAIVKRAEGLPLYAVETARMLIDEGHLRRDEETGSYQVAGELPELRVPDSLHALVAARLDSLPAAERQLLDDAGVIGRSFSATQLAALAGRSHADVEMQLGGLVRRELLVRVDDPTSPERGQFAFIQGVVREVAYQTMSRATRRAKHLAIARQLEAEGDDELASLLASHYLAAYQLAAGKAEADALAAQARIALRAAGERALALHSHEQALSLHEQALSITPDLAEQAGLLEQAGAIAHSAARAADAQRYYGRAIELYSQLGDSTSANRVSAALGGSSIFHGHVEEAIKLLEPVLAEVEKDGDESLAARVAAQLGRGYMLLEDNERALALLDRALGYAARANDVALTVEALTSKGPALEAIGRHHEAVATLAGALELIDMHGPTQARFRTLYNFASRLFDDDPRRCNELNRQGVALSRQFGQRDWLLAFGAVLVAGDFGEGNWDAAIALADDLHAGPMSELEQANVDMAVAAIAAYRGATERADRLMASTWQRMRDVTKYDDVGWAHYVQSEVDLAAGRYREAYASLLASARSPYLASRNLPIAAVPALLLRDRERMAAVRAGMRANPAQPNRFMRAANERANAAGAALDGDLETAAAGLRVVADEMRDMGQQLEVVITWLVAVAGLGSEHPLAREADYEARQILEPLGGRGMLARFDELRGAPPASAAAAGSVTSRQESVGARPG